MRNLASQEPGEDVLPVIPPRLAVAVPENKPGIGREDNYPDSIGLRTRTLARSLLPAGQWELTGGGQVRPRITSAHGLPCPDVSLSHSGGWAAAALAENGRVGIDLEVPRPGRDYATMAKAYFSAGECRAVVQDGEDAFLAFWTLREAVAKLGDDGLAAALALDGAAIIGGRNGLCGNGIWIAAHRKLRGAHLAVAWAPSPFEAEAERMLTAAMESIAGICMHT